jgi:hypothetical protein
MAHHFHGLLESNDPPLLVGALLQGMLTDRTLLLFRIKVHLRASTSVPGGSHEVESFFPS